ncbi:hypothetical protein ScPMuIL_004513 [Solemya velum]
MMKTVLLTFLLVGVFLSGALAKKRGRNKKDKSTFDNVIELGAEESEVEISEKVEGVSPCATKECDRGELCTEVNGKARCGCLEVCHEELDPKYSVCSTKNVTYGSECHLDRDHCLCRKGKPGCSNANARKIHLDYFGVCKELTPCPDKEMEQFPIRMRDWLFAVMRELANRHMLDEYLDMLEDARRDDMHADAVLWKFCDLDNHPRDRHVTRRELLFIISAIKPMEHCLVPFLDECDKDDDHKITLAEWGQCLGLESDVIVDKCRDIQDKALKG